MTSGTGRTPSTVVGSDHAGPQGAASTRRPDGGAIVDQRCDAPPTEAARQRPAPTEVTPLERFGAVTGLAAIAAVGVATTVETSEPTLGPMWLWWALYAVYVAVFLVDAFIGYERTRRRELALVSVLAVCGSALFTIQPLGWTGVLLVVTAASAAFTVGPRVVAALIAGQSLLVAGSMVIAWWRPTEALLGAVVYGSFMTFAALVVRGQRREADARAELTSAHERLEAAHADLSRTHAELRATSALLASATRSSERLRISRDLHDVVGHQLTALALELEVASHGTLGDDEHVLRARAIAKDLLRDVRAAVGELRVAPQQLEPALRELVRDLPGLEVHLRVDEDLPVGEPEALTIIRSVQELVTNTLRHAQATTLTIHVVRGPDGIELDARDDGRGAPSVQPGNGLTGLRERIEAHGGHVTFTPGDAGHGFAVTANLPAS